MAALFMHFIYYVLKGWMPNFIQLFEVSLSKLNVLHKCGSTYVNVSLEYILVNHILDFQHFVISYI